MNSRQRRHEEKRQRQEAEDHKAFLDRQEQLMKQDSCGHYHCVVTRFNWQGQPVAVMCEDCEAVNYLEENEL